MTKTEAKELFLRYKGRKCTEDEIAWIESWYLQLNENNIQSLSDADFFQAEKEMMTALGILPKPTKSLWSKISVAASVIILIALSIYSIVPLFSPTELKHDIAAGHAITPGGNKATLILGNGKKINLEDSGYGRLAKQSGISISKNIDGQLVYDMTEASSSSNAEEIYNTIVTPRAGTYKVFLPDGSAVWLNAASSIRFPTAFNNRERRVELTGEAYFEVKKHNGHPFMVITKDQSIQVLGTKFNVNSYENEPAHTTTLLEGKVNVANKKGSITLDPGQQARSRGQENISIKTVDPEDFIAWKDGVFSFNRTDLVAVMRQFERWYDIKVVFEKGAPETVFTGKIYRNLSLSDALNHLTFLEVGFHVKGQTVTVLSKERLKLNN